MRKISSRSSLLVGLLPTTACLRESHFQYILKPDRCHRRTVSGWTRSKALRHPGHSRRRVIQNIRSGRENRGRGCSRARIASCCRRARFSKRRRRRDRTERMSATDKSLSMRDMAGLYHRKHSLIVPEWNSGEAHEVTQIALAFLKLISRLVAELASIFNLFGMCRLFRCSSYASSQ